MHPRNKIGIRKRGIGCIDPIPLTLTNDNSIDVFTLFNAFQRYGCR